jgi:hypothetical protein
MGLTFVEKGGQFGQEIAMDPQFILRLEQFVWIERLMFCGGG